MYSLFGSTSATVDLCRSKTLGQWVDEGVCVQSASDSEWYQCVNGSFEAASESSGPAGACIDSYLLE
jgi:hypothetical protein